jgi:hypothetical protein
LGECGGRRRRQGEDGGEPHDRYIDFHFFLLIKLMTDAIAQPRRDLYARPQCVSSGREKLSMPL